MIKKEEGLGVIGIIILIVFIGAVIISFYYIYKSQTEIQKDSDIKSNMLLIQGATKVLYENCIMNKTEDQLLGYKISEIDGKDDVKKDVIYEFKKNNIIDEAEYEKYYVLTDENLKELKVDVKNEENSYYIVGYEKNDIIITSGYNGKYRLSEITDENTDKSGEEHKETTEIQNDQEIQQEQETHETEENPEN